MPSILTQQFFEHNPNHKPVSKLTTLKLVDTEIPDDILLLIFSFLDTPQLLRLSQVNREWKILSEVSNLWIPHFERNFKYKPLKDNVKQQFIYESRLLNNWKTGNCRTIDVYLPTINRFTYAQIVNVNNKLLAICGTCYGLIHVVELKTGNILKTFRGHKSDVWCLLYNSTESGKLMVSGSADHTIRVWDTENVVCVGTMNHGTSVLTLQVGKLDDKEIVVSAGASGQIKIWNLHTGVLLQTLTIGNATITAMQLYKNRLFTGSVAKSLIEWDLNTGQAVCEIQNIHEGYITCLLLYPHQKRLLVGSADKKFSLWDIETMSEIQQFSGHTHMVKNASMNSISPGNSFIVSCSRDKTIKIWNIEQGTCLATLRGHTDEINYISCNKETIISVTDTKMKIWDFTPHSLETENLKKEKKLPAKHQRKDERKKKGTKRWEKKEMRRNIQKQREKRSYFY